MQRLFPEGVWKRMFPKASPSLLQDLEVNASEMFPEYGCVERKSAAWYLANVAEESLGLTKFEESLYYTAPRLQKVWPRRFLKAAVASRYAKNPERLANYVYANRMGNGDEASGDGWRYRGRGPIQITGKDMYEQVDTLLVLKGALVSDPDLAASEALALPIMVALYKIKNLGSHRTFEGMVRAINGGTTNMESRLAYKKKFEAILK